ncbi:MAG: hypothetical protein ACJ8FY_09770 [Gemmataceae bacterium]
MKYIGWSRIKGGRWLQRVTSPDETHALRMVMALTRGLPFSDVTVTPEGKDPNDRAKGGYPAGHATSLQPGEK